MGKSTRESLVILKVLKTLILSKVSYNDSLILNSGSTKSSLRVASLSINADQPTKVFIKLEAARQPVYDVKTETVE